MAKRKSKRLAAKRSESTSDQEPATSEQQTTNENTKPAASPDQSSPTSTVPPPPQPPVCDPPLLEHVTDETVPQPPVLPETEPVPHYQHLDHVSYLFDRRKCRLRKDIRRMVCDCILTKEERQRGIMGCGEDCLNRMLMMECGPRCPLGDHCTNKRFQKRQYVKAEPFRAGAKGWGLRVSQPVSA